MLFAWSDGRSAGVFLLNPGVTNALRGGRNPLVGGAFAKVRWTVNTQKVRRYLRSDV